MYTLHTTCATNPCNEYDDQQYKARYHNVSARDQQNLLHDLQIHFTDKAIIGNSSQADKYTDNQENHKHDKSNNHN